MTEEPKMNWTPVTASSHPTVYRAMYTIDVLDNGGTPVVAYHVPPEWALLLHGAEASLSELTDEELETFCIGENDEMMAIRDRSRSLVDASMLLEAFFNDDWTGPRETGPLSVTAERFWGISTIYGRDAEHATPYMTRAWIGRLRLHVFHRGDADQDHHDHPWDFWTFPLTPYVEEVVEHEEAFVLHDGLAGVEGGTTVRQQVVKAFRVSFRPAEHTHRVLGRYDAKASRLTAVEDFVIPGRRYSYTAQVRPGRVITLVWRGGPRRAWGFLKHRDGRWCWVAWRDYVFGGGKEAPCS